jgi:hypothetical protein
VWKAIQSLRPAFSNATIFMWFATVVAGMIVRVELLASPASCERSTCGPNSTTPCSGRQEAIRRLVKTALERKC